MLHHCPGSRADLGLVGQVETVQLLQAWGRGLGEGDGMLSSAGCYKKPKVVWKMRVGHCLVGFGFVF